MRMFAAFTYRDFRVQWFGACTSSIGTWMQLVAQNWLVLSLTHSPFFLGLDAFLQQLPIILFSLAGGVLADRRDRRRTLLASQYVQMATSATLAALMYFQVVQIWHILTLSFLTGVAQSFGGPAYQSLIPSLVDKKDLPNAVALNSIQFNVARVLGPLLFAATLSVFMTWGYDEPQAMNACFALNSLSFLVVINTLMMLHVKHIPPATTGAMRDELKNGLSYVWHHGTLVGLTVLAAATTFLGFALLTFLPLFAAQVFKQGASTYSHLMAYSVDRRRAHRRVARQVQADGADGAADADRLRRAHHHVRALAIAADQRAVAVLHRLRADDGLLDGHLARAADCPQRDARPGDEHLHDRLPRRDAARQPRLRMARDDDLRTDRADRQRRTAEPRRGMVPAEQSRRPRPVSRGDREC